MPREEGRCAHCGATWSLPPELRGLDLPSHLNLLLHRIARDPTSTRDLHYAPKTISIYVSLLRQALRDRGLPWAIKGDARAGYRLTALQ